MDEVARQTFITRETVILSPPLVPEIKLHLAHEAVPLWQKTEEELGEMGLPPPFWAFAWAGGQALARFILDHPHHVKGLRVLDLASGSGLVAIAAALAGAAHVTAVDIDDFALSAMAANMVVNGVSLDLQKRDLLDTPPPQVEVILVGDLFYEKTVATRCLAWLTAAEAQGTRCYIGDPGRSYLPREQLQKQADYQVTVSRDLEDAEIKQTAVWQLKLMASC